MRCFSYEASRSPIDLSLYLVTHRQSAANDEIFISKVLSAVQGGVTCVQIRDHKEDLGALTRTAKKLKALLTPLKVPLIINNYVEIAAEVGVGVHLGQKDMPVSIARKILGPQATIGLSVDTWEDVIATQNLEDDDVNYLGVSQLFGSVTTKPDYTRTWGIEGLKKVRDLSKRRLVPIGGINPSNIPSICKILKISPKGDGIAMVGELWRADHPYAVAKKIRAIMQQASQQSEVDHV